MTDMTTEAIGKWCVCMQRSSPKSIALSNRSNISMCDVMRACSCVCVSEHLCLMSAGLQLGQMKVKWHGPPVST